MQNSLEVRRLTAGSEAFSSGLLISVVKHSLTFHFLWITDIAIFSPTQKTQFFLKKETFSNDIVCICHVV